MSIYQFKCLCTKCAQEYMQRKQPTFIPAYALDIQNTDLYRFECVNGHKNYVLMDWHPFEYSLLDAFHALIDRNFSSAVLNFASALDSFYQFCIDVMLSNRPMEYDRLKMVMKKSEWTISSFITLYYHHFLTTPFKQKELRDFLQLRNKTVHTSLRYCEDEAINAATFAITLIEHVLKNLVEKFPLRNIYYARQSTHLQILNRYAGNKEITEENPALPAIKMELVPWPAYSQREIQCVLLIQEYLSHNLEEYRKFQLLANRKNKFIWIDGSKNISLLTIDEYRVNAKSQSFTPHGSLEAYIKNYRPLHEISKNLVTYEMYKKIINIGNIALYCDENGKIQHSIVARFGVKLPFYKLSE